MAGMDSTTPAYISHYVETTPATNGPQGGTLWIKKVSDNSFNFGAEVRTSGTVTYSPSPTAYATNTSHFVVLSYTFGPDPQDDVVKLWVNPVISGAEPTPTITDAVDGALVDLGAIVGLVFRQDSALKTPSVEVDELRIANTWKQAVGLPVLSVGTFDNIPGLKVYPNPAKNILNITSDNSEAKQVEICDILGKVLLSTKVTNTPINVSSLSSGFYIVKVTEEGKTATRKLVIE